MRATRRNGDNINGDKCGHDGHKGEKATIQNGDNESLYGYLSRKVSIWLFKIFEIQKGRTFNFKDILRLCTIVVNIAIRSRA